MFDGNWRRGVDQVVSPIGQNLHRMGVTADHLTATVLGLFVMIRAKAPPSTIRTAAEAAMARLSP